jgi:uncharacterized protein YjbI with pentapeptide repeats
MMLRGEDTNAMANQKHLDILKQGVLAWNQWQAQNTDPDVNNLEDAELSGAELSGVDFHLTFLSRTRLREACLCGANLRDAVLSDADLYKADLSGADLREASLRNAYLDDANLSGADLRKANLSDAYVREVDLRKSDLRGAFLFRSLFKEADLSGARLSGAHLDGADLSKARLHNAHLDGANLSRANLTDADLRYANLTGANLSRATLVGTQLANADLTGCNVHGISVWDVGLVDATQSNLVITPKKEPTITVDNIEVAQFVYLLLKNAKIRDVIDTIGKKGVLLLGRFTNGRLAVLERLQEELRKRDLLPMVFNFDKPETQNFTETVRLLAGLSHFVIADITNPRSAPLELQATVPECMIPFVPILEKGEEPFSMFRDLWIKHRAWVFDPIRYPSVDRLIEVLDSEIVEPAKVRFVDLLAKKAEAMKVRDI